VLEVLGICMECIDGTSLSTVRRHKEFNHRMACVVLKDLCYGLGRLHEHGIVHNDVKDDNILVTPVGECYLCDFGVSLFLEDYSEGTEMPTTGTPHYMSPEIFFYDMVRYDTTSGPLASWATSSQSAAIHGSRIRSRRCMGET